MYVVCKQIKEKKKTNKQHHKPQFFFRLICCLLHIIINIVFFCHFKLQMSQNSSINPQLIIYYNKTKSCLKREVKKDIQTSKANGQGHSKDYKKK